MGGALQFLEMGELRSALCADRVGPIEDCGDASLLFEGGDRDLDPLNVFWAGAEK